MEVRDSEKRSEILVSTIYCTTFVELTHSLLVKIKTHDKKYREHNISSPREKLSFISQNPI